MKAILLNRADVNPDCLLELDLSKVTRQTEGFVARDLDMVVTRAIHANQRDPQRSRQGNTSMSPAFYNSAAPYRGLCLFRVFPGRVTRPSVELYKSSAQKTTTLLGRSPGVVMEQAHWQCSFGTCITGK